LQGNDVKRTAHRVTLFIRGFPFDLAEDLSCPYAHSLQRTILSRRSRFAQHYRTAWKQQPMRSLASMADADGGQRNKATVARAGSKERAAEGLTARWQTVITAGVADAWQPCPARDGFCGESRHVGKSAKTPAKMIDSRGLYGLILARSHSGELWCSGKPYRALSSYIIAA